MTPRAFGGFPPHREAKRKGREIDGGFRARAVDVARRGPEVSGGTIQSGAASA